MYRNISELNTAILSAFPAETLVFGEGSENASLMLIGEAPGEKEAEQGRPFVGKAGENLNEFLTRIGLERADLYITNAVKFRPCKTGKSGRAVNRPPTSAEIEKFRPFLQREIEAVSPEVVVTLGNTPLFAVTGEKLRIGDCHGQQVEKADFILFPLYHPASVIYNKKLREVYLADLDKLRELVQKDA